MGMEIRNGESINLKRVVHHEHSSGVDGGTIVGPLISLTAANNLDIGDFELRARTFLSDVVTGTPPFSVSSTTKVNDLNADLLDGRHASEAAGAVAVNTGVLNNNLNADLLDGNHGSYFGALSENETVSGSWVFTARTKFGSGNEVYIDNNGVHSYFDLNADGGILQLNFQGYNNGTTRLRDFAICDGKGNQRIGFDAGTLSFYMDFVSLYCGQGSSPSDGAEVDGSSLFADRHVTRRSLCKAWASVKSGGGTYKSYNATVSAPVAEIYTVTFPYPFIDNDYVMAGSADYVSGTELFVMFVSKSNGSCTVAIGTHDGGLADTRDFDIMFFGQLDE